MTPGGTIVAEFMIGTGLLEQFKRLDALALRPWDDRSVSRSPKFTSFDRKQQCLRITLRVRLGQRADRRHINKGGGVEAVDRQEIQV